MHQKSHNVKRLILLLGDYLVFQAALLATLFIRYGEVGGGVLNQHFLPFSIVSFLWLVVFYVAGLYDLALLREPLKLFRTYIEGMIANFSVSAAFFYLIPLFEIAPRTNLFLHFVLSLLLGCFWRLTYNQWIADRFLKGRVLFIGPTEEAKELDQLLETSGLSMKLVAALPTNYVSDRLLPIRWLDGFHQLESHIQEEQINTLVLGIKPDDMPELKDQLYKILFGSTLILDRAEIEEMTTGRIPLSYVSQAWFLHHLHESDKTWYEGLKRLGDILLSIPFLFLAMIITPFVFLAIKISSRGPLFFSQMRVGKAGKHIRIHKFRTMHTDAEKDGPRFTSSTATDPRIMGVGRVLRSLRIDELPQVWNVLRGDLSFIGPRPERPEFVEPLLARMPSYTLRHLTRPGLTGWAQVLFLTPTSSLEDNLKKLQYDLYYIKRRSFLLDIAILLKTIGIVLRRQGT